ncbi:ankyrin repeat-containing domain protein [Ephemerocybe angulata]|uniref:Ankyrin repeat-containing domain protein n=1 Tax=Ephemerocybe angulata TaxID=980116 RepID=A0A8H6MFP8_9AGAR|nr:ankyrin repeat-containing domain protein [Tulosesus angulatus]
MIKIFTHSRAVALAQEFETVILKILLASPEIDVNAPCPNGQTPLSFAVGRGYEGVAKFLLAAPGINVNALDARTPSKTARHTQMSTKFDPNFTHELYWSLRSDAQSQGQTPLTLAAQDGYEAVVQRLLAMPGIDVNGPDKTGRTPLSFAAENGDEAVVKLLLAAPGIDVNAPDNSGWTPLSFAACGGHEAVVKLFLAAPGIDVNAPNNDGGTPLGSAACGGHETVVKLLLAAPGINVAGGMKALSSAARDAHEAVVKLLLAVPGIDVNAADTSGWTALTWAVFKGEEAIVQDLCAIPQIIVDVADVKRHIENPPDLWRCGAASKDKQEKCLRILEEFVESESKGGRAEDGEGISGG